MVTRGCKCAISTKNSSQILAQLLQLRAALPRCAGRPALERKKMITVVMATIRATAVNAIGHETRRDFAEFDIGYLTLSVERFFLKRQSSKSMIAGKSKKKQANFCLQKNYRPPRPIGVKGGCSPQNNRKKT